MDNLDISNPGNEEFNKPGSPGEDLDKPIPFDDDTSSDGVSHSPLNLGGDSTTKPAIQPVKPITEKPAEKIVSSERITGVKTFFTKLHAGSIEFLDGLITKWLKKNPGVKIKRTNTVAGMVIGKKTEPNIIVTIWY